MCDGGWARLTARAWLRSPRNWDITYLPTSVRGVYLYLYLVFDVWSRIVVAWDGANRADPAIADALVSCASLRERYCCAEGFAYSKDRRQPLIHHADNGNALAAGFREAFLESHVRKSAAGIGCSTIILLAQGVLCLRVGPSTSSTPLEWNHPLRAFRPGALLLPQGFMQALFVGAGHPQVPHRIGPLAVQLCGSLFGRCFTAVHPFCVAPNRVGAGTQGADQQHEQ